MCSISADSLFIFCFQRNCKVDLAYLCVSVSCFSIFSDNHLLPLNRRQDVSPEGKLTIRNIDRQSDKGTYSCTASNKQGQEDSKSVVIEIKGETQPLITLVSHAVYL